MSGGQKGLDFKLTMEISGKKQTRITIEETDTDPQDVALFELMTLSGWVEGVKRQARGEDPFALAAAD